MRYFRAGVAAYESMRAVLDAEYGYPNAATKTETALPPAASLPNDSEGRVYLAVDAAYCGYDLPARLLADGMAEGVIEEMTDDAFREASTI
jgi:hypothetical protein